jgi:uncharacterized protein (DUF427 family)
LWFLAECVRTGDEGDEAMGDATRVKVERSAKRVRAYLGGEIIVDSIRSKLVWEVPQYPLITSRWQTFVCITRRERS